MDRPIVSEQESMEMAQRFTENMRVNPDSSGLAKLRKAISESLREEYGKKEKVLWALEKGFSLKATTVSKLQGSSLTVLSVPNGEDVLDSFMWGTPLIRAGSHNSIKAPAGRWDHPQIETRKHTELTFFDWDRTILIHHLMDCGRPAELSFIEETIKESKDVWQEKWVDIGRKGATVYSGRMGVNGRANFTEWIDYGSWGKTLVDRVVTTGTLKHDVALWTVQP